MEEKFNRWYKKSYKIDTSSVAINQSLFTSSIQEIDSKFSSTRDYQTPTLQFSGAIINLNQSYYSAFKPQEDYWANWTAKFSEALTNYTTKMANRTALLAEHDVVGGSPTYPIKDIETPLQITSDSLYKVIVDFCDENNIFVRHPYNEAVKMSGASNFTDTLFWNKIGKRFTALH